MNEDLAVPYGLDATGRLVAGQDAQPGWAYLCPGCRDQLVVRAGQLRQKHLAHRSLTDCNGETVAHETAKLLLVRIPEPLDHLFRRHVITDSDAM